MITTETVIWLMMLTIVALVAVVARPGHAHGETPPNVLVVVADDLGQGDLGSYGGEALTPNLDQLAAEGTRFTRAYTASPVCTPSRAGLLTGQWPWRHGMHVWMGAAGAVHRYGQPTWLDPTVPTIASVLRGAGYRTALFGKWHLGHVRGAPPVQDYGFETAAELLYGRGGPAMDTASRYWRAASSWHIAYAARDFIAARRGPWFALLNLVVPHTTLDPTPWQLRQYAALAPGVPGYWGAHAVYRATVSGAIDRPIGWLLDRLEDLGETASTIVVFASDNGPAPIDLRTASHSGVGRCDGRGHKFSLYECGLLTPLIVRWPGHVPTGESDTVVGLVDLLPTLAALAGAALPAGYQPDGENMSDVWLGEQRARTKPLLWQYLGPFVGHPIHQSPQWAIRDGPWKLLADLDGSDPELHHMDRDPYEVDDVATDYPDIAATLGAYR
jgi:arylsulfatase A-like enzyme